LSEEIVVLQITRWCSVRMIKSRNKTQQHQSKDTVPSQVHVHF